MIFRPVNAQNIQKINHIEEIHKQVLLKNGMMPRITNFSKAKIKNKQSVEKHSHKDMYEVYYVLKGKCLFLIQDQKLYLKVGDCLVVEPKEIHSLVAQTDLEILYFGLAKIAQ